MLFPLEVHLLLASSSRQVCWTFRHPAQEGAAAPSRESHTPLLLDALHPPGDANRRTILPCFAVARPSLLSCARMGPQNRAAAGVATHQAARNLAAHLPPTSRFHLRLMLMMRCENLMTLCGKMTARRWQKRMCAVHRGARRVALELG